MCKRNIEAHSANIYCRGKAINILYSECVFVAIVVHCTRRMRRITLSSVDCLAVHHFPTLSLKQHNFLRKFLNVKCVL